MTGCRVGSAGCVSTASVSAVSAVMPSGKVVLP